MNDRHCPPPAGADAPGGAFTRREVLKVGAGFAAVAVVAATLGGCGSASTPAAQGFAFLQPGDVELFTALAPAVATELSNFDEAKRNQVVGQMLQVIDGTFFAMSQHSQKEVRKLLDLLSIGLLRYVLTGVGAWGEAGVDEVRAFLARWRGSRFATLNAGGNVLVKLTASSFYLLPASWSSAGYPGPLDYVFNAINA